MKAVTETLLCMGLVLLFSVPAKAELADRGKPVLLEADSVRVDDAKKTAVYEGNVILSQGTLKVQADRIEVRQDDKGFSSGEATGAPVRFRQKADKSEEYVEGTASKIEYDAHAEIVRMLGSAWLRRGEDEIRGNLITYNMRSEQYRAEGSVKGVGEGRVRAILRPRGEADPETNRKPAKP
jgi:lipopolysaccharide export system protein LptA